ncbi:MAG TPA: protein-methionine-sulfoxide reductase catalytic subunit MsrP [Anaerolineales bacterium]|nr:protein-methionine-sulfoxide reductase catalytic subunit MsrP [Anaerolineales bacterium]
MTTTIKNQIPSSEITPKNVYTARRSFMRSAGILTGTLALASCGAAETVVTAEEEVLGDPGYAALTDELGGQVNQLSQITGYNNFYEFSTDKEEVAKLAKNFPITPWEITVDGLVNNPITLSVDELTKKFPVEDRVYRLRCVEGWSMVIPWQGFSLADLLRTVEPTSAAKFVRFQSVMEPGKMPGLANRLYPWPYQEGLRMDEALHPLTLLATGLYGGELPAQNGGGIRLVVPWKYGFKSIKSIVRIEVVSEQPDTLWNLIAPNEYGFYANVNPEVDHPRWSQSTERKIGELSRKPTLMFNGYESEVAYLYQGMDLGKYY